MRAFTANPPVMKAGAHFRLPLIRVRTRRVGFGPSHLLRSPFRRGRRNGRASARDQCLGRQRSDHRLGRKPVAKHCSGKRACETGARRTLHACRRLPGVVPTPASIIDLSWAMRSGARYRDRRNHLGVDARGFQRDRSQRNAMPSNITPARR